MRAWRSEGGLKGQGEGREELVSGAGLELGGGNSGWHRRRGEEIEKGGGGGGMVEMCGKSEMGRREVGVDVCVGGSCGGGGGCGGDEQTVVGAGC